MSFVSLARATGNFTKAKVRCLKVVSWPPRSFPPPNYTIWTCGALPYIFFFDGKLLQFYLMSFRVVVWTRRRRASVWECQGRGQWHSEAKKKVQKLHNICFSLHSSALVVVDFRLVNYPTSEQECRVEKTDNKSEEFLFLHQSCESQHPRRAVERGAEAFVKFISQFEGKKWKSFSFLSCEFFFLLVLAPARENTKVHLENYLWWTFFFVFG